MDVKSFNIVNILRPRNASFQTGPSSIDRASMSSSIALQPWYCNLKSVAFGR